MKINGKEKKAYKFVHLGSMEQNGKIQNDMN
jgi:hypothetical protein